MDASSLHTFISHEESLEASKYLLDKSCNKSISTDTLLQLIEHVLKMNTCHFIDRYYSQKQGAAMKIMRLRIAFSFMRYLEEMFFTQYEHSTPILYKQYIDIDGAALHYLKEPQNSYD